MKTDLIKWAINRAKDWSGYYAGDIRKQREFDQKISDSVSELKSNIDEYNEFKLKLYLAELTIQNLKNALDTCVTYNEYEQSYDQALIEKALNHLSERPSIHDKFKVVTVKGAVELYA